METGINYANRDDLNNTWNLGVNKIDIRSRRSLTPPPLFTYLYNFRFLVEIRRSHGGESHSLKLPKALQVEQNVAQFPEQRKFI